MEIHESHSILVAKVFDILQEFLLATLMTHSCFLHYVEKHAFV